MSYDPLRKVKLNSNNMTVHCSTPLQATPSNYKHIQSDDMDCCSLPYEDHDYESPVTSTCIISGVNKEEFLELPIVTIKNTKKTHGTAIKASLESNSGDLTRCICGFIHDDGYMICCDRCSVWQHIDCMEIDRNSIPETYLCEICDPRRLNAEKAKKLQQKKHREFLSNADIDSDELFSAVLGPAQENPSKNAIFVVNNVNRISQEIKKGRKRSAEAAKSSIHFNEEMKRPRSKSFQYNGVEDERESFNCIWNENMRQGKGSYQQLQGKNQYADCLNEILCHSMPKLNEETSIHAFATLPKVEVHQESLRAQEDIVADKMIIEYQGNFMLTKTFESIAGNIYQNPYPSLLFYNGFAGVNICVDARIYGSKAKFVRRSCCPNAEVRHVFSNRQLCLYIYSIKTIQKGDEITIPFDLDPDICAYGVFCACPNNECWVSQLYNSKTKCIKLTGVMPNISRKNSFENQIKNYGTDKKKNSSLDDDISTEIQKKKSREERKMEAIMRAFENLEKREKRRSSIHQNPIEKTSELQQQQSFTSEINTQPITICNDTPTLSLIETTSMIPEPTFTKSPVPASGVPKSRRQSTRARRPSAKLIDANGGLSNSYKSKGELNLSLLPVSEDSSDAANQEVERFLSNSVTNIYENDGTDKSVPTSVGMESLESIQIETLKNSSVSNAIYQDKVNLQSNLTPSVRLENFDIKTYLKVSENLFEDPGQEILPDLSTTVSKIEEILMQPATMCSHVITEVDLNPVYPTVSCTFVPWDFKPGKPSGMVIISSTQQSEHRSSCGPSKYIKKWWLKRAVIDSQAVAVINNLHRENNNNNSHNKVVSAPDEVICSQTHKTLNKQSLVDKLSWKKRFINRAKENSVGVNPEALIDDVNGISNVENSTESCDERENIFEENNSIETSPKSTHCNETSPDKCITLESSSKRENVEETKEELGIDSELKDDAARMKLNVEMNPEETECEIEDTLTELEHSAALDRNPAPIKRKVSYQEYLKRSKDGEKKSVVPLTLNNAARDTTIKSQQQNDYTNTVETHSMIDECSTTLSEETENADCIEKPQQMQEEYLESENDKHDHQERIVEIELANLKDHLHSVNKDSSIQEAPLESKTTMCSTLKNSPILQPQTEPDEKPKNASIFLDLECSNKRGIKSSVNILEEGELPGNSDSGDNNNADIYKSPAESFDSSEESECFTAISKNLESSCRAKSETSIECSKSELNRGRDTSITTAKNKNEESRVCQSNKTFVKNRFWLNRSPSEQPNGYAQLPRASHKSQNNLMFSEWDSHNRRDNYPLPVRQSFNNRRIDDRRFYDNRQYIDYPSNRRPPSPVLTQHGRPYDHDFTRSRDFEPDYNGSNHNRKQYVRLPSRSPPPLPERHQRFTYPSGNNYRNQWSRNYHR